MRLFALPCLRSSLALLAGLTFSAPATADPPVAGPMAKAVPRAVTVARATTIPRCTVHVDAAAAKNGNGTAARPFSTITDAVEAARAGAVICVAEGTYRETVDPGAKPLTLAGGFQRGKDFKVRDSSRYRSIAKGSGKGSFVAMVDAAPVGNALTEIDGFEITGYKQGVARVFYQRQRFNLTNNYIHDNNCKDQSAAGGGFYLVNIAGTIKGNVIDRNSCGRGGAGYLEDSGRLNSVVIANNLITRNLGNQRGESHGGALYLFGRKLTITGNRFEGNKVTGWGGGLYVGAYTQGRVITKATTSWNIFIDNVADAGGGGFFCDDSAQCVSDHDIYDSNCGGNVMLDSAWAGAGPTTARIDHMTNVRALDAACKKPGIGLRIDHGSNLRDRYAVTNSIFYGNAPGLDIAASCDSGCGTAKVDISYSMVSKRYFSNKVKVTFGKGILSPVDPLFVNIAKGDFHLQSRFGHWTANGYVTDAKSSPALAAGDPRSRTPANPPRAGKRTELGAYGNSPEASYVK